MLGASFALQVGGVFGTGVLASLSPCVYPMLPITLTFLGRQTQAGNGRKGVLLYAAGQTLTLFALGILAVQIGETLGFSSQTREVRLGIGLFLLTAGFFSWQGRLPGFIARWSPTLGANRVGSSGAFLFGVSAALVASPCTSPILGGVLALMATSGSFLEGATLMLFYSLGFSLLFLFLGLGVLKLDHLPRSGRWLGVIHKASSFLLMGMGVYYAVS